MTNDQILNKLTQMWQAKIKEKKLVKSGNLLNSIKFVISPAGLQMQAEDYYQYLDAKYSISGGLISSTGGGSSSNSIIITGSGLDSTMRCGNGNAAVGSYLTVVGGGYSNSLANDMGFIIIPNS